MKSPTITAFDQHAATTVAAVVLPGQRTPALHPLTSDSPTTLRVVERLRRHGPVTCCYEAGPCGFELQRALPARAVPCDVFARPRGKPQQHVVTAVARELTGCLWAALTQ
jgi:hypothetical protein